MNGTSTHGSVPALGHWLSAIGRLRALAAVTVLAMVAALLPLGLLSPAQAAPVGQGFTVTPADLAFILKQIKIAEAHVRPDDAPRSTGPCGALVGTGPNQIASPLLSFGLRTVDGTCNNLQPGQETFGAADQAFPRLTDAGVQRPRRACPPRSAVRRPRPPTRRRLATSSTPSRASISNLIVDQTSTNPAAVAAAGFPVRTQGNDGRRPVHD